MHRLGDYVAAVAAATAAGAAPTAAAATDGMLATCCMLHTPLTCGDSCRPQPYPRPGQAACAPAAAAAGACACASARVPSTFPAHRVLCLILLTFWPFQVIFVCFTANLVVIGHSLDLRLLLVSAPRLLLSGCLLPVGCQMPVARCPHCGCSFGTQRTTSDSLPDCLAPTSLSASGTTCAADSDSVVRLSCGRGHLLGLWHRQVSLACSLPEFWAPYNI